MIYESCYWKDDLLKKAKSLRRRLTQRRWPEATFAQLEQTVMLGFYSIRKLIEATKIADSIATQEIAIVAYPATRKSVTRMTWHRYWELYDLEAPEAMSRDLMFLCHQFVHSYVFMPSFSEAREFEAVLVSSDRERHRYLYELPVHTMITLFEQIGRDYPNEVRMVFNSARRDYDVVSVTRTDAAFR